MNYCSNCGNELKDGADVCLNCGKSTIKKSSSTSVDTGSAGWSLLGFFFPLIGLILFLLWRKDQPRNSSAAGKGALVSVIVSVIGSVVSYIIYMIAIALIYGGYLFDGYYY
jgi:drug/metabolite transporter (DMT)-like permease